MQRELDFLAGVWIRRAFLTAYAAIAVPAVLSILSDVLSYTLAVL